MIVGADDETGSSRIPKWPAIPRAVTVDSPSTVSVLATPDPERRKRTIVRRNAANISGMTFGNIPHRRLGECPIQHCDSRGVDLHVRVFGAVLFKELAYVRHRLRQLTLRVPRKRDADIDPCRSSVFRYQASGEERFGEPHTTGALPLAQA